MSSTWKAILASWSFPASVLVPVVLCGWIYWRGCQRLERAGLFKPDSPRVAAFFAGLAALLLALASPLDPLADLLLSAHMVQHVLLMIVAPVLLAAGSPWAPMVRGLPATLRRYGLGPLLRPRPVRVAARALTKPAGRWLSYVVVTWVWHAPALYSAALRSSSWHDAEHAMFFFAGLLFWWPVAASTRHPRTPRWILLPYLLLAGVQGTALSALFTFADHVIYPHYAHVPRIFGGSALDDQQLGGALFWVAGSVSYLLAAAHLVPALLRAPPPRRSAPERIRLPVLRQAHAATHGDLLDRPLIGHFLRWRHARLSVQSVLFALALVVVADGLWGPQASPLNLAGVLPWIHWRGLVVLALLVAGNLFCMACPFVLPARILRRWVTPRRRWPRALRSKWIAVALLVLFLWGYEAFSLWDSPAWTAWLILAYFAAATVTGSIFAGTPFCKYLCPIGQFHFAHALLSPREIRVKRVETCKSCTGRECIRGSRQAPGCGMNLLQPRKSSNMDCTFCLDCIHACPHDNVGVLPTVPGAELTRDPVRSGVGRIGHRADIAALVLVLVFGAFANAAGMVAPVVHFEHRLSAELGWSQVTTVTVVFLVALVAAPMALSLAAAAIGRALSDDRASPIAVAGRYSFALLPLGFGMWIAHYAFHALQSAGAFAPIVARWSSEPGLGLSDTPMLMSMSTTPWVLRIQILTLQVGLLGSLYLAYRIARSRHDEPARAAAAAAPWWALTTALFVWGLWILFQPMPMRGMSM